MRRSSRQLYGLVHLRLVLSQPNLSNWKWYDRSSHPNHSSRRGQGRRGTAPILTRRLYRRKETTPLRVLTFVELRDMSWNQGLMGMLGKVRKNNLPLSVEVSLKASLHSHRMVLRTNSLESKKAATGAIGFPPTRLVWRLHPAEHERFSLMLW